MNDGIFGFPPGRNITVDVQEFTETGIWYKPKNAKFCFIMGCGGGQAGFNGVTAQGGRGGSGSPGLQLIMWDITRLKPTEIVVIGAGGASNGAAGGDSIFCGHSGGGYMYFGGGVFASNTNRNCYIGGRYVNNYSLGGAPFNAGGSGPGFVGSFGPGGGGAGAPGGTYAQNPTGRNGSDGGRARSFSYLSGVLINSGGGASGGILTKATLDGSNADPSRDIDGFGEGAGGGAGSSTSDGGNGGRGRRGSGGGGGGGGTAGRHGLGGPGGDGFIRIMTYCWE